VSRRSERVELSLTGDWSEFLRLLQKHRVRFLIVGAHALAAHGRPRFTGDFDLFVDATPANAKRVHAALCDFGVGMVVSEEFFASAGSDGAAGVTIGLPPMRLDVLKSISGVTFAEAWRGRVSVRFEGKTVAVIGLDAYIKNKRAAGRTKDLLDIALLEESGLVARRRPPKRRRKGRR
jgi:hypothetical protein